MTIPAGIVIAWPGALSALPSGWSRVAALDGIFLKGAAAGIDPGVTGGSDSHSHGSTEHIHTIPSHGHTSSINFSAHSSNNSRDFSSDASFRHRHSGGNAPAVSGTLAAASVEWPDTTIAPRHYTVVWIQSDGTPAGFPNDGIVYWSGSSLPTDWSIHDSSDGTYHRGASAGSAGGALGGATDTTHTHTATHIHGIGSHTHGGIASGNPIADPAYVPGQTTFRLDTAATVTETWAAAVHTHSFSVLASIDDSSSASGQSDQTSYDLPSYKLAPIQNDVGASSLITGAICAWLGLRSAIPSGWSACDGQNDTPDLEGKYVENVGTLAEIGDSPGSITHNHTTGSHTHSYDHNHGISGTSPSATQSRQINDMTSGFVTARWASQSHPHNGSTSTAIGTTGSATGLVESANHEPRHRTVIWVQFKQSLSLLVDSPTDAEVVDDPSPTIDWSFPDGGVQNEYRVQVYSDQAELNEVYDSEAQSDSDTQHTIPLGSLDNGQTYYVRVTATVTQGADTFTGTSAQRTFDTLWNPPAEITGVTATSMETA